MRILAALLIGTLAISSVGGCGLPTGLLRSRWAMDDPEYAAKYEEGAEKSDLLGKVKQASDARFVEGATGLYASAGTSTWGDSPSAMAGAEIGYESYFTSYLTGRADLAAFANSEDAYLGGDLGLRLQVPSRIAPFAGAGVFAGYAKKTVLRDEDGEDNNDDGAIDEPGEEDERISGAIAAVYPELGIHYWWTPQVRLTGHGRYLITTDGRDSDDWLIGGGIAVFRK
jgi:hypothetical protein